MVKYYLNSQDESYGLFINSNINDLLYGTTGQC